MTTAAVVGIGDISTIHLQAITETNQIDLVGVCDSVPERADRAAQEWGVPAFTDHQSLLRQARPQVLHITLPHYLHVPVALDALAAGSHVLTEKPLSHTYQSAQRLAEVARDADRKLGVCFQNRYNPTSLALRQALVSGRYGAVRGARAAVWWERDQAYYQRAPWRGRWDQGGGGVLINQTIHTIDLLCWLLGAPQQVAGCAASLDRQPPVEVEDAASIVMHHPGGVRSIFFATTNHTGNAPVEIEVVCERGVLRISDGELSAVAPDGSVTTLAADVQASGARSYWGRGHQLLIEDFHRRLADPEPFWIDADAALVSLGVLRTVYVQSGLVPESDR